MESLETNKELLGHIWDKQKPTVEAGVCFHGNTFDTTIPACWTIMTLQLSHYMFALQLCMDELVTAAARTCVSKRVTSYGSLVPTNMGWRFCLMQTHIPRRREELRDLLLT